MLPLLTRMEIEVTVLDTRMSQTQLRARGNFVAHSAYVIAPPRIPDLLHHHRGQHPILPNVGSKMVAQKSAGITPLPPPGHSAPVSGSKWRIFSALRRNVCTDTTIRTLIQRWRFLLLGKNSLCSQNRPWPHRSDEPLLVRSLHVRCSVSLHGR